MRYGWHRQAAWFTIETSKIPEFKETIYKEISKIHDIHNLPKKELHVECIIDPTEINVDTLADIDHFRPFGIGNPKPLFLLENITIATAKWLGEEEKHISLTIVWFPALRFLMWNTWDKKAHLIPGNIVSLIVEIDKNEWKWNISTQCVIKDFII